MSERLSRGGFLRRSVGLLASATLEPLLPGGAAHLVRTPTRPAGTFAYGVGGSDAVGRTGAELERILATRRLLTGQDAVSVRAHLLGGERGQKRTQRVVWAEPAELGALDEPDQRDGTNQAGLFRTPGELEERGLVGVEVLDDGIRWDEDEDHLAVLDTQSSIVEPSHDG